MDISVVATIGFTVIAAIGIFVIFFFAPKEAPPGYRATATGDAKAAAQDGEAAEDAAESAK